MRLEAAVWGALCLPSVLGSAVYGLDAVHGLHHRHQDFHQYFRKQEPTRTVNAVVKRSGVFGAPSGLWPTVTVPPGFTLAAGVELTPLPEMATTGPGGSAALASAIAAATSTAVLLANTTAWDKEAEAACLTAVTKLQNRASNPAGLAVCYNVPYLDQHKGTFEAEIRMYTIAAPVDPFVGVTPDMMMVTLQYEGATIQKSDGSLPVKRSLEKRQTTTMPVPTGGITVPVRVAVRSYVGQVNKALMSPGMNITEFQPLLVPRISISATNPITNQVVNTTLSSTESSFVAGVFSRTAGNLTDPKYLAGKPAAQLAAAAAGSPTPFVLPGTSLGVFPVGLIVTLTWLVFFAGAVGFGTIGRIQFREQYRKEVKGQQASGFRRF